MNVVSETKRVLMMTGAGWTALAALVLSAPLAAQNGRSAAPAAEKGAESLLPPGLVLPAPTAPDAAAPEAVPAPAPAPRSNWTKAAARQLLVAIQESFAAGLDPADYQPQAIQAALDKGRQDALNEAARSAFAALARDLRDGRAPKSARVEWYITDGDAAENPTEALMEQALASGDVAGVLAQLEPVHPDYLALKRALAQTPPKQVTRIARLKANLDRWRWMPRSLGNRHILVNVPAYHLELIDGGVVKTEHKIIVGTPSTTTPQLNAMVQGVIFNPSWYVPQSIMKEGLTDQIRKSPAAVRARGYDWKVAEDGTIYARQLPSPKNALGLVKIDMPNDHAIFIHDTPAKELFDAEVRTFSHGCLRTNRAMYLAGMLSGYYGGKTPQEIGDIVRSGETTKVPVREPFPVYIAYFTATPDADGRIVFPADIYDRDAPLMALFSKNKAAPARPAAPKAKPAATPPVGADEEFLN